jgi:hypothetical protein
MSCTSGNDQKTNKEVKNLIFFLHCIPQTRRVGSGSGPMYLNTDPRIQIRIRITDYGDKQNFLLFLDRRRFTIKWIGLKQEQGGNEFTRDKSQGHETGYRKRT